MYAAVNYTRIGSDNGLGRLAPIPRQGIIWTKTNFSQFVQSLGANFNAM